MRGKVLHRQGRRKTQYKPTVGTRDKAFDPAYVRRIDNDLRVGEPALWSLGIRTLMLLHNPPASTDPLLTLNCSSQSNLYYIVRWYRTLTSTHCSQVGPARKDTSGDEAGLIAGRCGVPLQREAGFKTMLAWVLSMGSAFRQVLFTCRRLMSPSGPAPCPL